MDNYDNIPKIMDVIQKFNHDIAFKIGFSNLNHYNLFDVLLYLTRFV